MKRLLLMLSLLLAFVQGTFAQGDSAPEVLNLGEVIDKIGYPMEAKSAHVSGKVLAQVSVDDKGKVSACEILESPSPILSDAVKAHVDELKFRPAKKSGTPVKSIVKVPFLFELPETTHFTDLNAALASLGEVESLDLSGKQLKAVDSRLPELSSLRKLDFSNNQIPAIPSSITKLRLLEELHFSNNPIGSYPKALKKLKSLKHLYLVGTKLSPEQLDKLQGLFKDCEVHTK
jgi:TonB family protein